MIKKIPIVIVCIMIALSSVYVINNRDKILKKKTIEEKIIIKDGIVSESIFKDYYNKASNIVSKMTLKEKVGQLFLVRYEKNDIEYLNNFYPGGYILFAKDFENNTKETMKKQLEGNQNTSKYPLIFGVDEEGGYVTRVSRFKAYRNEKFKSPKEYYEEGGYELLEKTEKEKAKLLKDLGINLNLAPVADVSTNENDFIYSRTFGYDAEKTSELITKMVEYSNENKINSTLKHFPGYGNNIDTHTGIALDERKYSNFIKNDYKPFEAGIKAGVPTVLVSHNVVNCLDDKYPASLSKKVILELREKLGFTGIIMTDDLAMSAVKSYVEDKKAATMAINAGNDMIITSDFMNMKNEIIESVNNKEIKEEIIDTAVTRIIAWKYYSGLMK